MSPNPTPAPSSSTRRAAAWEAQDTWCSVLTGIDAFEGRSSFKTWLLRILLNTARSRGQREHRTLARSCVPGEAASWEPLLEPVAATPEALVVEAETFSVLCDALESLPQRQRTVFVLRDLNGCMASEVCERLGTTSGNQRVLLHRARTHLGLRCLPLRTSALARHPSDAVGPR